MCSEPKDLGKLQKCIAPVTSADLFKSPDVLQQPRSKFDLHRFLSREARVRQPSSLKAGAAGLASHVISLSTGRPSPDTYPFLNLHFSAVHPSAPVAIKNAYISEPSNGEIQTARLDRENPEAAIDLSIALSYGYSLGHEQLIQFLTTHVSHVHAPPYSDWEVCLTVGNTSALEIALRNFTNPGDYILVEEYTYSGTIEAAKALGVKLVPVRMDHNGICPQSLELMLSSWVSSNTGASKPRILYTIPTGQNPTGTTQPLERREAVLEVAEKHDLLVVEDDPYYYLQFPRANQKSRVTLLPSYLSLCTTGRVMRLDSTSKIVAPGLRLGWLTAPKAVAGTFQASHDLGIVHPSGLSQSIAYMLLSELWGHSGFERWLWNLASLYHHKAMVMMGALDRYLGSYPLRNVCSWTEVEAGMFVWLRVDCSACPRAACKAGGASDGDALCLQIEDEIYQAALQNGVLCCKGSFFRAVCPNRSSFQGMASYENGEFSPMSSFFRLTFASVDNEDLVRAISLLADAVKKVLGLGL